MANTEPRLPTMDVVTEGPGTGLVVNAFIPKIDTLPTGSSFAGIFEPGAILQIIAGAVVGTYQNTGTTAVPAWTIINVGPIRRNTPTAINSTATATEAQVLTGFITSTSEAATTITLPTGTLLGAALGATAGTVLDLWISNTAGANTVTVAVAVNGILNASATANSATFGLLTVPSGVTGQGRFTLSFSSATAYSFSRTA